jgi:alkylation response protein AidB-like acyl-CoA dehydrogenase
MDFRFTEEQTMTAEAVRGLLADLCQPADLRRQMQAREGRDKRRWAALNDMGLAGALVPEACGGLGLKAIDFILVAEACGHAGLPEPLVENAGVSLPLLASLAEGDRRASRILERALAGGMTVATAHPANLVIADADTAEAIIVDGSDGVFLYEADAAGLVRQESVDPFRRLFTVKAAPDDASRIATASGVRAALDLAFDRGALFTAAQLLGIAQRAVDLAVAYAKERQQFGKPIGSYQAVKHLLSTVQVRIESVRPVVYAAAAQLENADVFSRARISHAKLAASEAADLACRTAVQVHGAMGYSWEVDVHFFLKRALAFASWWGDARFHRERVAARAFDRPLGAGQTFASEAAHA